MKVAAVLKKRDLIKKRQTALSAGPGAWTHGDFENLLEVASLHEPRFMAQRCLGGGHWLKGTNKYLWVGTTLLVKQLERIQQILRRTWAERRRMAAGHRAAVAASASASAAGGGAAATRGAKSPTAAALTSYHSPLHVSGCCVMS